MVIQDRAVLTGEPLARPAALIGPNARPAADAVAGH